MLRNPDEKTLERLSSEYPQAEIKHKDKMYEKVRERMSSNDNVFINEVSGVEKYTRRHLWKGIPAAVMSLAIVCGAVGGGVVMLKRTSPAMPSVEMSEETTALNEVETTADEAGTTTTVTANDTAAENTTVTNETNAVTNEVNAEQESTPSEVTKDMIFAICENGRTQNFDKISYTYEERSDYDTGYHDDKSGEVNVDNTQNTASTILNFGYYRGDGSIVYQKSSTDYTCNGKKTGIYGSYSPDFTDEENNRKEFYISEDDAADYVINDSAQEGKTLLENFDEWEIIGTEEYLGRKCAVISGTAELHMPYLLPPDTEEYYDICNCEYTITIDIETGVWMKSSIKHTDFDLAQYSFTITGISYGDAAKSPISKDEFKKSVLDGCVKCTYDESGQPHYEPVNESDLDFLN